MYDSLLDEIEDDVVSHEVEDLTAKVTDVDEADLLADDAALLPDAELEAEAGTEVDTANESDDALVE
ncbi:MAG: hypothetical protein CK530_10735, partial [Planctomycetaceae bacterium]